MNAIALVMSGACGAIAGAGLALALRFVDPALDARRRHLAASVAFWITAAVPAVIVASVACFPNAAPATGLSLLGPLLPDALPAQRWLLWLARAIVGLAAGWAVWRCLRLVRQLRRFRALAFLGESDRRDTLPVRIADVPGAMLVGYRRPAILLPMSVATHPREVVDALVRHERAHARRRDNWRLLAEHAALAMLPWCRPLRDLHAQLLAAREELCDADALRGLDGETRAGYARALLDALRRSASAAGVASTIAGPAFAARRRVAAIIAPEGPARAAHPGRWLAAFVALALATGGAAIVRQAGSAAEAIAGLGGMSIRFAAVGDASGTYRVSTVGGASNESTPAPGVYRVRFSQAKDGRWVVSTAPVASRR